MNNRPDDRTQLLAETLHGEWATGPAAAMAQRAAAHARRRRTLRSAAAATTLTAIVAVALFFAANQPGPLPTTSVATAAKPAYEIISDEEFLTTMRDRPLLVLPQESGPKKFVLLERSSLPDLSSRAR